MKTLRQTTLAVVALVAVAGLSSRAGAGRVSIGGSVVIGGHSDHSSWHVSVGTAAPRVVEVIRPAPLVVHRPRVIVREPVVVHRPVVVRRPVVVHTPVVVQRPRVVVHQPLVVRGRHHGRWARGDYGRQHDYDGCSSRGRGRGHDRYDRHRGGRH